MSTVEYNLDVIQPKTGWDRAETKPLILIAGAINPTGPPKLFGFTRYRRRKQTLFNFAFYIIRQLAPITIEKFYAVVVIEIMRGTDHNACVGLQRLRQISYSRGRNRPQQEYVHPSRHKSGFQSRLKHIAG